MKPTGKGGIASIIITTDKSQADWEEEKYLQLMSKRDKKWFPKEWLAYVMVGKPALWMTLSTLTSGGLALSSSAQEELNTKIRASIYFCD